MVHVDKELAQQDKQGHSREASSEKSKKHKNKF